MDWAQMKERCPSARFVGVAMLADHRLAFTRKSIKRDCGVADAVRQEGRTVWGVVFDVPDHKIGALDRSEGYQHDRDRNAYWRRESTVFLDGNDVRPLTVATYFAEPQESPPLPSQAYKDLILAGARYWHLPADYIGQLEGIKVAG